MDYLTVAELEELGIEGVLDTANGGQPNVRLLIAGDEHLSRADAIANLRRAATEASTMAAAAESDAARSPGTAAFAITFAATKREFVDACNAATVRLIEGDTA